MARVEGGRIEERERQEAVRHAERKEKERSREKSLPIWHIYMAERQRSACSRRMNWREEEQDSIWQEPAPAHVPTMNGPTVPPVLSCPVFKIKVATVKTSFLFIQNNAMLYQCKCQVMPVLLQCHVMLHASPRHKNVMNACKFNGKN